MIAVAVIRKMTAFIYLLPAGNEEVVLSRPWDAAKVTENNSLNKVYALRF
jgi:hypothetical protein